MNDYACILIWDAHTRMGHNIVPYAYGTSHTRMGQYTHMGQNTAIYNHVQTTEIMHVDKHLKPEQLKEPIGYNV